MYSYFSIASLILFSMSLYVLGRANGWSKLGSVAVSFGSVFGTIGLLTVLLIRPLLPAILQEVVAGVALTSVMIVLFALSKSVARKITRDKNAPC